MKWLLLVRPEAEQDIAATRDWYDAKTITVGDGFLDEIAEAMRTLASHPKIPRLYWGNFRRILLTHYPYKVFYQVIGERVVTHLQIIENGREIWRSHRIALDGVYGMAITGRILTGNAVTGYEGEAEPFAMDLDTREFIKASAIFTDCQAPMPAKKPWWKFWL